MPWEETETAIRSGHRSPDEFEQETLKVISISEKEGIQAIVGRPKGKTTLEVESYLFAKEKGWNLQSAQEWFSAHYSPAKEHLCIVLPFTVAEKILDKPLRIQGLAMATGISRNLNIYTAKELEAFSGKLVDAPVYLEHVTAQDAVGKVVKTNWDGANLLYEAEIYDEDTAQKIRKGLIRHVSVGADYESIDLVNGKVPHGLYNAEMSLVAVPGISETNIQILEKLNQTKQDIQLLDGGTVESLTKKPTEPTLPISDAIRLIEEVLPSQLVQRSWSLGPQRMCQELTRVLHKLRSMQEQNSHRLTASN